MTYQEDQHNQAKSDMLGEFNKAILDAEDRRETESKISDAGSVAGQKNLEDKPGSAGPASRTGVTEENKADNCP